MERLGQEGLTQRQCNTIALTLYSSINSPLVILLSSSFHELCNYNFITAHTWMKLLHKFTAAATDSMIFSKFQKTRNDSKRDSKS